MMLWTRKTERGQKLGHKLGQMDTERVKKVGLVSLWEEGGKTKPLDFQGVKWF